MSTSDKKDQLEEVKLNIRCLLVSNDSEMTISDLRNEYYKLIGTSLEIKNFGYRSIEVFLRTECQDILKINFNGRTNVLCPIITDATKGLNSLILKQRRLKKSTYRRKTILESPTGSGNQKHQNEEIIDSDKKTGSSVIKRNESPICNLFNKVEKCHKIENNNSNIDVPTNKFIPLKNTERYNKLSNIKNNLRLLMNENVKIKLSRLAYAYFNKFGENLFHEELGYTNLECLCDDMSDIFAITKLNDMDWLLYDNSSKIDDFSNNLCKIGGTQSVERGPNSKNVEYEMTDVEALPYISIEPSLIPKNCVEKGYEIKELSSPCTGSELNIFVAEVVDPSHFWFHLCSPENSEALDSLMKKIDKFYKNNNSHYMIKPQIEPGHYCAVKFHDVYHRAVILSNISRDLVKVRYIDYGTIMNVAKKDLRLLLKEFTQLPIQALRGRLHGVKPNLLMWNSAARRRFLNLVSGISLYAKVIQSQDNYISSLTLIDESSDDEDIVICQQLCTEGLCKFDEEYNVHQSNDSCQFLLPNFKDIELGLAPNFFDFENGTEIAVEFQKKTFSLKNDENDSFSFNSRIINLNNNDYSMNGNTQDVNKNKIESVDEFFDEENPTFAINKFDNVQENCYWSNDINKFHDDNLKELNSKKIYFKNSISERENLRGESDIAASFEYLQINQQFSKPCQRYNIPSMPGTSQQQNMPSNLNIPLHWEMPIPYNLVQPQNMPLQWNIVPQQFIPQAQYTPSFQYMPMQQNISLPQYIPFQQSMPTLQFPHYCYSPPQQNRLMQYNMQLPKNTGLELHAASLQNLHNNFKESIGSTCFNVGERFDNKFGNNNCSYFSADSSVDNIAKTFNQNPLPNIKNGDGKDYSFLDFGINKVKNEKSEDSNNSNNAISNELLEVNTQMFNLKTNTLELIGIENIAEYSMEIWRLQCRDIKLNSLVVIIEQLSHVILKSEVSQDFVDFVYKDSKLSSKIWCIEFEDTNNVDYIKQNGKSNIEVGKQLEVSLLTDKNLNSRNSLAILSLQYLGSCLMPFKNVLKVPINNVLKDVIVVNKKYS